MQWILNLRKHIRNRKRLYTERERKKTERNYCTRCEKFHFSFQRFKNLENSERWYWRLGKYQSYFSLMYRILLLSFLLDPTLRLSILSRQEGNVLPKHTNEHARISLTMICGLALKRLVDSILIVEKHEIYKSSAYPLFTNYHGGRYMVDVLSDFVNFFFKFSSYSFWNL